MTVKSSPTTITTNWSSPSLVPVAYNVTITCSELCELEPTYQMSDKVSSNIYQFVEISPGSYCNITLVGLFGSESVDLHTLSAFTSLIGNILYITLYYQLMSIF